MPTAAAVAAAAVTAKITAMDAVPVSIHRSGRISSLTVFFAGFIKTHF